MNISQTAQEWQCAGVHYIYAHTTSLYKIPQRIKKYRYSLWYFCFITACRYTIFILYYIIIYSIA